MTGRNSRLSVAELRSLKGGPQLTMVNAKTIEEVEACASAGIDMLAIPGALWSPEYRRAAGCCFVQAGTRYGRLCTADDYLREAFRLIEIGADAIYCAASPFIIEMLAREGIPVMGHVGLIPSKATWTGGFRAVGKTAAMALYVLNSVRDLEDAGAIGAEMEVVPDRVTRLIAQNTSLFIVSMGSGAGADAQYLFAEDILGNSSPRKPRHAKSYADFATELQRLQVMRQAAFEAFARDVASNGFPEAGHTVSIPDHEFETFAAMLAAGRPDAVE